MAQKRIQGQSDGLMSLLIYSDCLHCVQVTANLVAMCRVTIGMLSDARGWIESAAR